MLILNYFKKYPYALVLILIMLVWIIINSIEADKYTRKLEKEGVYTIATITNIKGARSGRWVEVTFSYNGREFKTKQRNQTILISWIGKKIFIKFLPSRPEECDYYELIAVPDSLKNLFSPVWKEFPIDTTAK
jgi:hypothetical protein